jgi:hypothetical protein
MRHDHLVPVDVTGLDARWTDLWGSRPPVSYELRGRFRDRWVRFHSLPGSQRCATCDAEYREIMRRHVAVLTELAGDTDEDLVAVTVSWSDTAAPVGRAGELSVAAPDAVRWTSVLTDDSDREQQVWAHLWVSPTSLGGPGLERLLRLAADDVCGPLVLMPATARWLYAPYDGGADVIAETGTARDQLRERHPSWLPAKPAGL